MMFTITKKAVRHSRQFRYLIEDAQRVVVGQWPSLDGHYPEAAYQAAFGLSLALQTAALVWFAMPWIRTFGKNLSIPFAEPHTVRGSPIGSGGLPIDGPILEACEGVEW